MVNNAGISIEAKTPGPIHLATEEKWDTTMAVNAKSVFLGSKYALAQMIKQDLKDNGQRGCLVNISSIMGLIAGVDQREFSCIIPRDVDDGCGMSVETKEMKANDEKKHAIPHQRAQ